MLLMAQSDNVKEVNYFYSVTELYQTEMNQWTDEEWDRRKGRD